MIVLAVTTSMLIATSQAIIISESSGFIRKEKLELWLNMRPMSNTTSVLKTGRSYTGKPFVEGLDSYVFKYRVYNQSHLRWTREDPSGFQDGANASFYAPMLLTGFDYAGLLRLRVSGIKGRVGEEFQKRELNFGGLISKPLGLDIGCTWIADSPTWSAWNGASNSYTHPTDWSWKFAEIEGAERSGGNEFELVSANRRVRIRGHKIDLTRIMVE